MPPRKFRDFRLSQVDSDALLSDKSARQCLTKNNCNKMRSGGCYGQGNLLFASSSASMKLRFVYSIIALKTLASKINGWSPCMRIIIKYKRLWKWKGDCTHSSHISFCSIHCQCNSMREFLSYQPYCKCPKFGPDIGWTRNWLSRWPASLVYECSFEQWARILVGS